MALIQMPWESHVLFTAFFTREHAGTYWRFQSRFALLALLLCALTWGGTSLIPVPGIKGLMIKALAAALFAGAALLVIFRRDLRDLLQTLHRKH